MYILIFNVGLIIGIAIGKDGNVFVIDDRRVRKLSNDGGIDNHVGSRQITCNGLTKGKLVLAFFVR